MAAFLANAPVWKFRADEYGQEGPVWDIISRASSNGFIMHGTTKDDYAQYKRPGKP